MSQEAPTDSNLLWFYDFRGIAQAEAHDRDSGVVAERMKEGEKGKKGKELIAQENSVNGGEEVLGERKR